MVKRINQDLSEGALDDNDYERLTANVRGAVWNHGGSWEDLAARANLSPGTVSKFAYGETKRPHARTLNALLRALGWRLAIVPAATPRLREELHMSTAALRRVEGLAQEKKK